MERLKETAQSHLYSVETVYDLEGSSPCLVKDATEAAVIASLAGEETLKKHKLLGSSSLTIMICDNARMQDMNRRFMGIDTPTDVLAFNEDEGWKDGTFSGQISSSPARGDPSRLGDIALSIDQIKLQAVQVGKPWQLETAILTVHGVLHLLGYDHEEEEEHKRMFALTDLIIDRMEKPWSSSD